MVLPGMVEAVVEGLKEKIAPVDTVYEKLNAEARKNGGSFALALYMLGFRSYEGFKKSILHDGEEENGVEDLG